jgi:hypothetical protein
LIQLRNPNRQTHHLLGNIDLFLQSEESLLDRACDINLRQVIAKVRLLLDQCDESIFDLEENSGAGFNIL